MTVSVLEAVFVTYSHRRSQLGVTWWGIAPTGKRRITRKRFGSITSSVPASLFGTYTRAGTRASRPPTRVAVAAA
jgi:hypothetical protein